MADRRTVMNERLTTVQTVRERVAHAIHGGIDVWDVRLVIRTDGGSITRERLAEVLPELIEGGICIDVTVESVAPRA